MDQCQGNREGMRYGTYFQVIEGKVGQLDPEPTLTDPGLYDCQLFVRYTSIEDGYTEKQVVVLQWPKVKWSVFNMRVRISLDEWVKPGPKKTLTKGESAYSL